MPELLKLAMDWRLKAERLRERFRGQAPGATEAAACALETCAEELEEAARGRSGESKVES